MKDIRHALTHRQLTIFEFGLEQNKKDDGLFSIEADEMLHLTIQLLRLVKEAIIYLINTVTLEEKKKNRNSGKRIATMSVDTTQFLGIPKKE